jgi:D-3-phosphoglycerate dehydrogenase
MTFHVTVEYDRRKPGEEAIEGLEPLYEDPEIEISYLARDRGPELTPEDLEGADAYVSYSHDLTDVSLEGVESLKIATRSGAGYDNFDLDAMTEHGVIATHAPQGPTASAAQAATGMIISCAHNFPRLEHELRTNGWEGRVPENYGFELQSATLGFVGMGLIGGKVLSNLSAFRADGLEAQVYDPYMSEGRVAELGVQKVDLDTLLETSDIVTIHVPLTEETHHMLGTEDFERMQDSAYLVNTSRGGIYPDEELATALEAGEIRGAAIDVFEGEPDVEGNPLLDIEDIHLTPHIAGVTHDAVRHMHELMAESIMNLKNGEPPINVLNPPAYETVTGGTLPEESYSPSFRG